VVWPWLTGLGLLVSLVLLATAGRYGYHRDELYFVRAGQEPAFGYVDQPPLTPLFARAASELFGESPVGLRVFSALAAGLIVLCTGLIAREFEASRTTAVLAAACMSVSAYLAGVGHLLSTSTFDLLAWTILSWLLVRALRDGGPTWLLVGVTAGIALQNKMLVAFFLLAVFIGVLTAGPRSALRTAWIPAGVLAAVVVWSPYLIWQAGHGWPQLELSTAIAAGSSGTSESRWLFLPFQLVLVSIWLAPVWIAGLWRLTHDPAVRTYRAFAVAYALLAILFLVTGGKPYYSAGMFPILLAAGAAPTVRWAHTTLRAGLVGAALALSAVTSAFLFLPLVPAEDLHETPIAALNYDAGETVGWPEFAGTVAGVYAALPTHELPHTVFLGGNYGEAGAIDLYSSHVVLPPAYSGHNSYASWGPPPESARTVIAVGFDESVLRRWFGSVTPAARVDNGVDLDNDEQGETIWVCRDRTSSWDEMWPRLQTIG
jgi:hypothetical protein